MSNSSKVYNPSEKLKQALASFSLRIRKVRPDAHISFSQTDRDVQIDVRVRLRPDSPYMNTYTYYVWEEGGDLCGASA